MCGRVREVIACGGYFLWDACLKRAACKAWDMTLTGILFVFILFLGLSYVLNHELSLQERVSAGMGALTHVYVQFRDIHSTNGTGEGVV